MDFFRSLFLPLATLLWLCPLCLLGSSLFFVACAHLKRSLDWPVAYSRKLFHFLTFMSSALIYQHFGLPTLCVFGASVSIWIALAIYVKDELGWYGVLARPQDAPHKTKYIVFPYLATLVGGFSAHLISPLHAVAGFWVVGVADALAEPVGRRFGKHEVKWPLPWLKNSTRTLEGSLAVVLSSWIIYLCLIPFSSLVPWLLLPLSLGIAMGMVEACSPHGWDNFTLQISATGIWFLMSGYLGQL